MPCFGPVRDDWKLSFFGVKDFQDKTIDVESTFNRKPFWLSFLAKLLFTGWALQVLGLDLYAYSYPQFYLAYLTHWAFAISILYFVLSFVLTLFGIPEQPTGFEPRPTFVVRLVWGLFSTAACTELVVTALFWIVEYSPDHNVTYESYMKHGGFAVLIVLEGLVINKIPIRLKHCVFVIIFSALYFIWTVVHAYADIGNPLRQDGDVETDDDSIYESLSWKNRPAETAIVSALSLLVVTPILFVTVWSLSLCRRRYVKVGKTNQASRGTTAGSNYSLMNV